MSSTPPVSDPAAAAAGRSQRRVWIALVVAVALVAGLRASLPWALELLAGRLALAEAGLELHTRKVDLLLLRGEVAIEGLWLAPPGRAPEDGSPPDPARALLACERLRVGLVWSDLVRGRIRLDAVRLDAPRVRLVRRADGRLETLPERPPQETRETHEAPPEPDPDDGGGWPVLVDALALRDGELRVVEEEGDAEALRFGIAQLDLERFALDADALALGAIRLVGPHLRAQGALLAAAEAGAPDAAAAPPERAEPSEFTEPSEAPEPADPEETPRRYAVDDVAVEGGGFELLYGERVLAGRLALAARDVRLERGHRFPVELHLEVGDAGRLDVTGEAAAAPVAFTGRVEARDLPLRPLTLPLRQDLHGWLRSAAAGADLSLDVGAAAQGDEGPSVRLGGRVTVSGLDLQDPAGDDLAVAWQALDVRLREVRVPLGEAARTRAARIDVERVALRAPAARYRRPSDALARLLTGPQPPPPVANEGGAPAQVRVDVFELADGALVFHDGAVEPAFDAKVSELGGEIAGIDPGAPSAERVNLAFTVNGGGTSASGGSRVELDGSLGGTEGRFTVKTSRLRLPPVNPYARAAGLQVARGALSVETEVRVEGRRWTLDNSAVFHDVRLDREASQQFIATLGMPVDLVLAVLRDAQGDIRLDVPIAFDEGASETSLPVIVAGALRQALVGAASIPLKTLGGVLGVAGDRVKPVAFAPGVAAEMAEKDGRERGVALLELLDENPALVVVLTGRAGEADEPFLPGELPAVGAGPEGEAAAEPDEAPLDALARARAETVRRWLVEEQGIDPARVVLADETKRGAPGVLLGFDTLAETGRDRGRS